MGNKKTLSKKAEADLEKFADKKPPNPKLELYAGIWLVGSKRALKVTRTTPKSLTLEHGGVSLGKHFGELHERKPS